MIGFNDFKKNSSTIDDEEDVVVFMPSGEVIDISLTDIYRLIDSGLIRRSEKNYFVSDDSNKDVILSTIEIDVDKIKMSYIKIFLLHCGVKKDQFIINKDMSININGSIDMSMQSFKKIPYKFNRCTGDFLCSFNNLTTLINSPNYVGGKFDCTYNYLENLIGGPNFTMVYNCSHNNLTSLEGSPIYVKYFNCSNNKLKNYDFKPDTPENGKFISTNNPIVI